MNLKVRITRMFLFQIVILLLVVCGIGIVFGIYATKIQEPEAIFDHDTGNLMEKLPKVTSIHGKRITVSKSVLRHINKRDGWLQILNSNGKEVYQYLRPKNITAKYSPGQLVYDKTFPRKYGYQLYTWYGTIDGHNLTWLYGLPLSDRIRWKIFHPYAYLFLLFTGSLVATIIVAILFGRRIGAPILHMMKWIQRLANGSYSEPSEKRLVSHGKNRPKPFNLYREVLDSLSHLTVVLKRNDFERKRLERTREDWITGISHDLRTPLSSVKGYADILANQNYQWDEHEIKNFGKVISEKASYMEGLIEDLSLTFRLRNNAIPLQSEVEDVVEILRRAVIELVNHRQSKGQHVQFECDVEKFMYPLDAQWFKRAFDNLLANASLHNPKRTTISIDIKTRKSEGFHYNGFTIYIKDDGVGMSEDTLQHLFDRYYRGTNTLDKEAKGTGLGSAIAKQLIEAHRGRISVDSQQGVGTTIKVEFPPTN